MSARERAVQAATDHAAACVGAMRDALGEVRHGEGSEATEAAITASLASAYRHAVKLLGLLGDHTQETIATAYASAPLPRPGGTA